MPTPRCCSGVLQADQRPGRLHEQLACMHGAGLYPVHPAAHVALQRAPPAPLRSARHHTSAARPPSPGLASGRACDIGKGARPHPGPRTRGRPRVGRTGRSAHDAERERGRGRQQCGRPTQTGQPHARSSHAQRRHRRRCRQLHLCACARGAVGAARPDATPQGGAPPLRHGSRGVAPGTPCPCSLQARGSDAGRPAKLAACSWLNAPPAGLYTAQAGSARARSPRACARARAAARAPCAG